MTHDTTQAWVVDDYRRPEDLTLGSSPLPELGEGDLLVDVEAMSLNPLDLKLVGGSTAEPSRKRQIAACRRGTQVDYRPDAVANARQVGGNSV